MQVIILEDHPIIADSYCEIIKSMGYRDVEVFYDTDLFMEKMNISNSMDVFFVDYNIKKSQNPKIKTGIDVVKILQKKFSDAKFIINTQSCTGLELFQIYRKATPNGLWYKGDVKTNEFKDYFNKIIKGIDIISPTVNTKINAIKKYQDLDELDLDILLLLAKGHRTSEIPDLVCSSISTVNSRKSLIKSSLGIEGVNDVALINKCTELDFI
jgi:two-component system, NarL family, response regulator NreC